MSRRAVLMQESFFEKRTAERHRVDREGWLRCADGEIIGVVVLDISASGVGVELFASRALDADDPVEVALEMSSPGDEVWLPCAVQWRSGDRVGLSLAAMSARQRAALGKLLAAMARR